MGDLEELRKNVVNTRGRPFQKGNPGRPRGALNKTTLAIQELLDGEAEALTRKAIELAKEGDITALRLCLDRILPVRKDRPITVALPQIGTIEDVVDALGVVTSAVAEGEITPSDAATLAGVLETKRKAIETLEIERRIAALEQRSGR